MTMRLLTLLFIGVAMCTACEQESLTELNLCTGAANAADCVPLAELTEEETRNRLIGEWEQVESGTSNRGTGVRCDVIPEDQRIRYAFDDNSVLEIRYPDGSVEMGTYEVITQCGIAPPCFTRIVLSGNFATPPNIANFCGATVAFFDDRPVDGSYVLYRKQ